MNETKLRELLEKISAGDLSVNQGIEDLKKLPFENLGWACLDHHRYIREGFPEVVYGPGKTCEQLVGIISKLISVGGPVLVTRVSEEQSKRVVQAIPEIEFHPIPKSLTWSGKISKPSPSNKGTVLVISAGTADLPVAEEACLTLGLMGHPFKRIYDVGVAGIHRLLDHLDELRQASVIIAVAGMDGVLPSILGGIVSVPVVAVPSSTGYGSNFQGLAPLLTMLNSCATGVAVVNIDNGFGAGAFAATVNRA
ncbi:MAG: nickel pincer cofactor biosynthesis protein LarB [Deltaproteobacteria bacterium]|nr:nickel pincer cofactor biosynthesis protein LarB [Deltaproteobacteria bacterium]MBW1718386.1 nickel pincer cofactor biosynthesis protein LarB [Deltaproteobacteria bacterium]MBW1937403.1 nickel pincer cofactor biosynthesis protein LarB [Deltaproteobacteria bacterium]MBW1964087.1 nickel pincer cofactor biosynthesis protein LarB [Deltaproteobacteria bacterium]MBW2080362.1 nickel pincer cofactor biosynthesis protein LarB [Deltaproteobacteria bacterium]